MDTILELDLSAEAGPKYQALAEAIRGAVRDGRLAAGAKLPPVRDLAFSIKVTPGTVARAYQRLTEAGVLSAHVGRGTFVAEARRFAPPSEAEGHALDLCSSPELPDLGQVELIRRALREAAELDSRQLLSYPNRDAGRALREAFLRDLEGVELGPVTQNDLVLSHGAQHAFGLILATFLEGPDPVVAIEALSYPGFRHAARAARARVVAVECDGEGPIPESLAAACDRAHVALFVTSAEAQSPTTVQTTPARRAAIAALARARDIHIVEDECYGRPSPGMPTYRALAPERSWYIGSLSKSFSPALRAGYLIAPAGRSDEAALSARHSSFGLSKPIAYAAARIAGSPEARAFREAIEAVFAERGAILAEALAGYALAWRPGLSFTFLRLPRGWRTSNFVRAAEARGVLVRSADDFMPVDGKAPNAVRISLNARVPLERFRAGAAILRELLGAPPQEVDA